VGYPKAINFEEDIISRYYWTFDAIALPHFAMMAG
jgi:hypothetical protein